MDPGTLLVLIGSLLFVGAFIFPSRDRFSRPKALPTVTVRLALRLRPPPPNLFELAGVLVVDFMGHRMGERIPDPYRRDYGRRYRVDQTRETNPELLGTFIADFRDIEPFCTCDYCGRAKVTILQVVLKPPPVGAQDIGLVERAPLARYCSKCGRRDGELLMAMPPEPFRDLENLHDILKLMAADNGKLTKQIRLDMLSEEYARVQPRACEIAREMDRLQAEIRPRTDLDPYRGLPLAKLDDPPDRPAKALPAPADTD